ncbi:MAG: hypothetical protein V1731_03430 [Candidatus Aenigmatarchaeota archaeon]
MVMKFLRTTREAAGDFFSDFRNIFSDPLLQSDIRAQVRPMLEKQGFKLSRECIHEACSSSLYIKGKGERRELFIVGTIETFYKGRGNFGGQKESYRQCTYANRHGDCSIPSIGGEGEWIPTVDLPQKLRKYF